MNSAKRAMEAMMQDLTTVAPPPTSMPKSIILINPKIILIFLGKKDRMRLIDEAIIVILYPESTTICISPDLRKSSRSSFPRDDLSPTTSPPARAECGSPNTDSRL